MMTPIAPGQVNQFSQAWPTAVSGICGLGTLPGVGVAFSWWCGAQLWMIVCGIVGMSSQNLWNVPLGVKYRNILRRVEFFGPPHELFCRYGLEGKEI